MRHLRFDRSKPMGKKLKRLQCRTPVRSGIRLAFESADFRNLAGSPFGVHRYAGPRFRVTTAL